MPVKRPSSSALHPGRLTCLMIAALALGGCDSQPTTSPRSLTPAALKSAGIFTGKVSDTGSVTLQWTPPSQNVDGTPLQDLAGYRVYYSQAPWGWTSSLNVPDPDTTTVRIGNLSAGTWYFMVSAYNAAGAESNRTDPVTKML